MARRMAVKAAAAAAQERQQPIIVPDRLLDPHPLVKATATALRQTRNIDCAHGAPPDTLAGALDIRVSRGCLDRALRITDTLLKALALHGITAGIDPKTGTTRLHSGDITLTLAISEQIVAAARRLPGRRTTVGDKFVCAAKPTFQGRGHGSEPPATPIRASRSLIGGSGSSRRCGCSMTIPCTFAVVLPLLVHA